jgi:hypothetical protein
MKLPGFLFLFVAGALSSMASDTIEIRVDTEHHTSDKIIVGYTEKLTLVGEMSPEITVLDRVTEGTHTVDISRVPEKTELLYLLCDGYAPQFVRLKDANGRVARIDAKLFLKRYVTVRYAENPDGPDFSSITGDTLALTQFTYPTLGGAWEIEQRTAGTYEPGMDPILHYWQVGSNLRWGAVSVNKGFDAMTTAPADGYVGTDYPIEKRSSFYLKNTKGYAKLEVVSIGTERPQDIKIIEFTPKIKD